MGVQSLVHFANLLRTTVGDGVSLDICMQTNGLLLTESLIDAFRDAEISISLSLDGPEDVNDLHRKSKKGRSSFQRAEAGLELLKSAPDVFSGVISVIDPQVEPRRLLEYFSRHKVPKFDFLLPDAHHLRQPPGRTQIPNLYEKWLISAFDLWFDEFPELPIRTFEALLDVLAGLSSQTDAFGFGDVSLITIETDGTYHDLDVFKIVGQDATRLSGSVIDTEIKDIACSAQIEAHRKLLRKEGLCRTCQQCEIVDICGGGSLPHRYGLNGFSNPTVYCREMQALVSHARNKIHQVLKNTTYTPPISHTWNGNLIEYDWAEKSTQIVSELWDDACESQRNHLREVLASVAAEFNLPSSQRLLKRIAAGTLITRPGMVAWSHAMHSLRLGRNVHAVDGTSIKTDYEYLDWLDIQGDIQKGTWEIHSEDPWLRFPFGRSIYFESKSAAAHAMQVLDEAKEIIWKWRPALAQEMLMICRSVQFIRDPSAHPEKIVSFSDNSVPGALYVSVYQGDVLIDPFDLADSLIHEYRHQKLYLLERKILLIENNNKKIVSPWREELRPPSGLFHAIFVFIELRRFWRHVLLHGPKHVNRRAESQLKDTERNLIAGFKTLFDCPLTNAGRNLAMVLSDEMSH